MFLITASSCLASLHHSQLIKHFLLLSTHPRPASLPPAHRAPAPSWLLSLGPFLPPLSFNRLLCLPGFPAFKANPRHGWGDVRHVSFPKHLKAFGRSAAGRFDGVGGENSPERCCGNNLDVLGHPSCSSIPPSRGWERHGRAKRLPGYLVLATTSQRDFRGAALEGRGSFLPRCVMWRWGVLPNRHPIRDALPRWWAWSRAGVGQGGLLSASCWHGSTVPHCSP